MYRYFPDSDQEATSIWWIIHPLFVPDDAIQDDGFPVKEELITMWANEAFKIELQNQNEDSNFISQLSNLPTPSKRDLKLVLTYTKYKIKTKKRIRLNVAKFQERSQEVFN